MADPRSNFYLPRQHFLATPRMVDFDRIGWSPQLVDVQ
jgi:hypothetical protein